MASSTIQHRLQLYVKQHARLDALITLEYSTTSRISRKDRRWFRRPSAVIFTETLEYKTQWLESVKLARARYARRHRLDLTYERKSMRTYLRRKSSTN